MLVRSCFLITLIKCLKGHKSLGSLFVCQLVKSCEWVSESVSQSVTRSPIELLWTAKNIKAPSYYGKASEWSHTTSSLSDITQWNAQKHLWSLHLYNTGKARKGLADLMLSPLDGLSENTDCCQEAKGRDLEREKNKNIFVKCGQAFFKRSMDRDELMLFWLNILIPSRGES